MYNSLIEYLFDILLVLISFYNLKKKNKKKNKKIKFVKVL